MLRRKKGQTTKRVSRHRSINQSTMPVLKKAPFLLLAALPQVLSCADSTTFTFGSYPYNGDRTTRTCAWLLENNVAERQKNFCTYEYEGTTVQDECPIACDACPPTSSPTITISPSAPPTQQPSEHPSDVPTLSPTFPCLDSLLRLKIPTAGTKPKAKIARYCTWVGNKDTINRCALPGVSAACPVTCGTCSSCEDPDDELRFKFTYNGQKVMRNCEFVGRIKKKVKGRCKRSEYICRSTCGYC